MNEQFRVAQKLGLMFRPEEALPAGVKSWAINQLHDSSPAIGIETEFATAKDFSKEYKYTLGQDLKKDVMVLMRSIYRANKAQNKKEYLEDFELVTSLI